MFSLAVSLFCVLYMQTMPQLGFIFWGKTSEAIFRPLCEHNSMPMSTAVSDSGGRKHTPWMCRVYLTMLTQSTQRYVQLTAQSSFTYLKGLYPDLTTMKPVGAQGTWLH